jgi:hypothetical protein
MIRMGIIWNENAWCFQRFVKEVATSMEEGQALWNIIENSHIFKGEKEIVTGSFRWNAHIIASVTGGDYLNYYCASEDDKMWNGYPPEAKKRVLQRIADLGYVLREVEWDSEELTEEIIRKIKMAEEDSKQGRVFSNDEVKAKLGLDKKKKSK